jgi:hypothetical protein
MINLPYFYPHCKTWTEQKAMNIGQEIEECPYCSAIHTLKYETMATVWRWDLELPSSWQFPQWESVRLFPIQVNQPVLSCNQCGKLIKVIPSFIQQGTTLTLSALIFVAFAYEFSNLTWRDLPQKFCAEDNRIAHSTLYKAVHGLGRLIHSDLEFRKLCQQYLPTIRTIPRWPISDWPPPKSIYTHTVIKEKGVRFLIRSLWPYHHNLSAVFDRFVISLEHVFVNSNKAIPSLYKKDRRRENTALNSA